MNLVNKAWKYKAIWFITLLPLVIAWAMAYSVLGIPKATKNNGILMPAGIYVPATLNTIQKGKWGLLVISDDCKASCQQQVYKMQQLHKSLGKFYNRLQPIWLTTQSGIESQNLVVNIDFSEVTTVQNHDLVAWFNQQALAWQDQSVWLIDPTGTLVMRFKPDLTARQVMDDLSWLLTISRIG